MKIPFTQMNISVSQGCTLAGYTVNATLQTVAGLAASVAIAQIGNRVGYNPLDGIFHSDVVALDSNTSAPYVPAILLGGSCILTRFGQRVQGWTDSLANRAEVVKTD